VCETPTKDVTPSWKISINQFRADLVTAVVPPGRIIFAIDVAKVDAKTALEKVSVETSAQHMAATVGKATSAVFSAFVGDPANFPSASAYVKAFGMNLKEKSSGKFQGHLKLTKRGPGRARQYLWLAVCRWVRQDHLARAWYEKKVQRDAGKKAKAIVALMRKLAGALYHIGRGDPLMRPSSSTPGG
jgi:transposase